MKKTLIFLLALLFVANTSALEIKNQTKKAIIVIANYSNEKFYRVYELKPTLFNREPTLKINLGNLQKIQIYNKIPTKYKTGKTIKLKQLEISNDIHKNPYKKILKKAQSSLPDPILEIDQDELNDKEFAIMMAPQGKLTFVEIAKSLKGA